MAKIVIENPNLGGIADSIYLGQANSVAAAVGLDLHGKPGLIRVNQKLTKESGSTVDVRINCMVQCSDGSTYLFGNSGKIYKRTSGGTYSLEATAAPAAGSANITGAYEDQGKIYYFMELRVGRWAVGTAWSTRNDSWATFSAGEASFHPAVEQNLIVYIGDAKFVAQIEDDVFTGNALDLKAGTRIRALGRIVSELVIGTYIAADVWQNHMYRWNTWSESFSSDDEVPEEGVNAIVPTDNFVLVQAGTKGNLYSYSNDRLERLMRIPGDWDGSNEAVVHFYAVANRLGIPLFGLSNVSGNPALQGVYSVGSYGPNYPSILNLEYIASCGSSSTEITAIVMAGETLLVAWQNAGTFGVDKLDASAKYASAYLDTRAVMVDRTERIRVAEVIVAYKSLPSGTGVNIKININHAGFGDAITTTTDTDQKLIRTTIGLDDANVFQVRIEPTVNGNTAPEIERVEIILPDS